MLRWIAGSAATLVATACMTVAASAAPTATAAKTCSVRGVERTLGPSYVASLSATGVGCGEAREVVKAYYRCRVANGVSGRCVRRVRGFGCTERRTTVGAQFDASVTCAKRGASVRHAYTQTV